MSLTRRVWAGKEEVSDAEVSSVFALDKRRRRAGS
jgi:hypothetical protein